MALTPRGEYTHGIEGPAVGPDGTLYVVNFKEQGSVGRVSLEKSVTAPKSELFIKLPAGSVSSSIRFGRDGRMFVADYKKHNIYVVEPGSREPRVYFHDDRMSQPNDMTIARDGTIFASDPNWKKGTGQIWAIRPQPDGSARGVALESPRALGTTNGIDLSPDGRTLYVSEKREIWAYDLESTGSATRLVNARRLIQFEDAELDGLRVDVDGVIYVARILAGKIAIVGANGQLLGEIAVTGKEPNNLAFGGADGRTVYVTQREGGFVESFRVERPGREWCEQKADRCVSLTIKDFALPNRASK